MWLSWALNWKLISGSRPRPQPIADTGRSRVDQFIAGADPRFGVMELTEDRLVISKPLSALDEDVVAFVDILERSEIGYAIVSGDLAILTGRSRGTEDIDVLVEPISEERARELTQQLTQAGGPAMPLDDMYDMLSRGDRIRVAEAGDRIPNFEVFVATTDFERRVIDNRLPVRVGGEEFFISPIEEQIAYKVKLAQAQDSATGKDFEDALHLYHAFEGQFNRERLEACIRELGAIEYYGKLRAA